MVDTISVVGVEQPGAEAELVDAGTLMVLKFELVAELFPLKTKKGDSISIFPLETF